MQSTNRFKDRVEAGRLLADQLKPYRLDSNVLILALPRGGVPVGYEVARLLRLPLDVFLVRKLGVPGHKELAMGAIASNSEPTIHPHILNQLSIPASEVDKVIRLERVELSRREKLFRMNRPDLQLTGKTILVIDDGLATGSTMLAAVSAIKQHFPKKIVVAVPVASHSAIALIESHCDEIVCLSIPEPFYSVGLWYENFEQTTDEEVIDLLARASDQDE